MTRMRRVLAWWMAAALCACGGSAFPGARGSGGSSGGGSSSGGGPVVPIGEVQQGTATWYRATGAGNCSFDATPGDLMVTALNHVQWAGSALCGACAEVTGPTGTVVVRVVDQCPDAICVAGHLDLSEQAYARITGSLQDGVIPISWRLVACDVTGPVAYRFKEDSSQWWTAIQVRNHRLPVTRLELRTSGGWIDVPRTDYDYFVQDSDIGTGQPFHVRITAVDGQQLEDALPAVQATLVVQGAAQFR